MNGKTSIAGMFAQGADGITDDMDRIVGRTNTISGLDTCAAGCWLAHPGNKEKRDACLNACAVKYNVPLPAPPAPPPGRGGSSIPVPVPIPDWAQKPEPQPVSGNILDFSSPLNTIVKSLFFLSLSPMFAGTHHFYIISVGCTGAIIYSLFKQFNR